MYVCMYIYIYIYIYMILYICVHRPAEPEIDPEMIKLKINDVAMSLMGTDNLEADTLKQQQTQTQHV